MFKMVDRIVNLRMFLSRQRWFWSVWCDSSTRWLIFGSCKNNWQIYIYSLCLTRFPIAADWGNASSIHAVTQCRGEWFQASNYSWMSCVTGTNHRNEMRHAPRCHVEERMLFASIRQYQYRNHNSKNNNTFIQLQATFIAANRVASGSVGCASWRGGEGRVCKR